MPITIAIILLLLYVNFRSVAESLIILLSVPFAVVGSVWLLWALGYNLSVAVSVGLIALAGVAAEIGVVMLVYLDQTFERHGREERLRGRADLLAAVREGAEERVRAAMRDRSLRTWAESGTRTAPGATRGCSARWNAPITCRTSSSSSRRTAPSWSLSFAAAWRPKHRSGNLPGKRSSA